MRGGVIKQGDVFQLSDGFGDIKSRVSWQYKTPTLNGDSVNNKFPGKYRKCGAGIECNSDPNLLFTKDPIKLDAYNNFISSSNNARKFKTPDSHEGFKQSREAFRTAFGSSRPNDIAKFMTEEQLNNFIDADQAFKCFDENALLEINQEGGPMYTQYCNGYLPDSYKPDSYKPYRTAYTPGLAPGEDDL